MSKTTVTIEASERDSVLPDCPIVGCEFQSYDPDRMHDHLGPDGHDLWETIITAAEVRIDAPR